MPADFESYAQVAGLGVPDLLKGYAMLADEDSHPDHAAAELWAEWGQRDSGDEQQPRPAVEQAVAERTRVLVGCCWHSTGTVLFSNPPQYPQVCCWHGETRIYTNPPTPLEAHGPHAPTHLYPG